MTDSSTTTAANTSESPSIKRAIISAIFPFIALGIGVLILLNRDYIGFRVDHLHHYSEDDPQAFFVYLIDLATTLAVTINAVLLFLATRRKRIPSAILMALSLTPWVLGLAAIPTLLPFIDGASESAGLSHLLPAVASGFEYCLSVLQYGMWMSGILLIGVSGGFALATNGQPKSGKESAKLNMMLSVASVLPMLGCAGYLIMTIEDFTVMAMGLLFLAIVTLGVKGLSPFPRDNNSSPVRLSFSVLAPGIAAIAAIIFVKGISAFSMSCSALESASPDQQYAAIGKGAEYFQIHMEVSFFIMASLLLPVLVYVFRAKKSGNANAIPLVDILLSIGLFCLVIGFLFTTWNVLDAKMETASKPAWAGIPNFSPKGIEVKENSDDDGAHFPDVYLLSNQVVSADGKSIGLNNDQSNKLGAFLKKTAGPTSEYQIEANGGKFLRTYPELVVGLDSKTDDTAFHKLIDAASEAGFRSIRLVTAHSRTLAYDAAYLGYVGIFRHFAQPSLIGRQLWIGDALEAGCEGATQVWSIGIISGNALPELTQRNKRSTSALTVPKIDMSKEDAYWPSNIENGIICITLQPSGALHTIIDTLEVAASHRQKVVFTRKMLSPKIEEPQAEQSDAQSNGQPDTQPDKDTSYRIQVRLKAPLVNGDLKKKTISNAAQKYIDTLNSCGGELPQGIVGPSGKVAVKFIIGPDGEVQMAAVASSTIASPEIEKCLTDAIRKWRFPKVKSGGVVIVTIPMTITPN